MPNPLFAARSPSRAGTPGRPGVAAMVLLVALAAAVPGAGAEPPRIQFVNVAGDRATLKVGSRMYVLEPGEATREGVRLLSVNRREVVVRVAGRSFVYPRRSTRGRLLTGIARVPRAPGGMFLARGAIEGQPVDVVVDTGASHVVLSEHHARRLGLRYSRNRPVEVTTASRREIAYAIVLDSVAIGGIVRARVPALVTRGRFPEVVLLGMSFLSPLQVSQSATEMVIREPRAPTR